MTTFIRPTVLLLLISLFFSSCTEETKPTDSKNDLKIFRYNQASAVNTLDPAYAKDQGTIWVANQIFNTLVQFDDNLNIVDGLAERWENSDDGLVYTFYLRKNIPFHKDANLTDHTVTAEDVAYSFSRILDPKLASPGSWIFSDKIADEDAFVALDEHTFQLSLKKPFRPIMGILCMQYCSIVSKKAAEHYGVDFRSHPVGSGPFQYKNWKENDVLILEKNPNYWEKDKAGNSMPKLDAVRISFNENKQAAYLDFKQGKLDFLSGIDPSYQDELLTEKGELHPNFTETVVLDKSPFLNSEYLGFLLDEKTNPALSDKRVRQAINYGFDREKMMRFLRNNVGVPATAGFVPKGLPSYNPKKVKGYTYQPEKAKKLLAEAGYTTQNPLPQILLETTSSYVDLCTFIQKQLTEIGINIRLETIPSSSLRERMSKSESPFFRASWIADYPDAESFLTILYGDYPAPPNYTRFNNKTYNEIYQKALLENDDETRFAYYQAMDQILIEEAPIVPLYYDEVLRFKKKKIKGLNNNGMNLLMLKNVSLD